MLESKLIKENMNKKNRGNPDIKIKNIKQRNKKIKTKLNMTLIIVWC